MPQGNHNPKPKGPLDPERAAEMRRLREEGKTLQEIADKFGVTRERVRQVIGNTGRRR